MKTFLVIITMVVSINSFAQNAVNEKVIPCESIEIQKHNLNFKNPSCVIRNIQEFKSFVNEKVEIDFSKYSLIGVYYSAGGCKPPSLSHSMFYSEESKEFRFVLNVQQNGLCKMLRHGTVWCLAPKISEEAVVTFETKESVNKE